MTKCTTRYSLSEIDALAKKASRGAGYSWGIAEEVGKAVRWLSAYGFSGPEALEQHLTIVADEKQVLNPQLINETSSGKSFGNDQGTLCAITCGALINDLGHHIKAKSSLSFTEMLFPILALPSAGRIAEAYNISVSFTYAQTTIVCNPSGITIKDTPPLFDSFLLQNKDDVVCDFVEGISQSTHFASPESRIILKETLDTLEKFAHSTYAPATEESRLRGAG